MNITSVLSDRHRTSLLMLLWCVAIIAHYEDRMHRPLLVINICSMVFAVIGLFLARSTYVMLAVATLQVAACWTTMPDIDNHWMFSMFVSLAMATGFVAQLLKDRFVDRGIREETVEMVAPFVRLLVLSMYFFAVFHKLNSEFLNPKYSCAIHLYRRVLSGDTWLPLPAVPKENLNDIIIYGVLVLELLPFLFLAWRRTWFLGIVAGFAFHFSTGLIMRHFPTIMICLYAWFIPRDVFDDLVGRFDRVVRKLTRGYIGIVTVLQLQTLIWSVWTLSIIADYHPGTVPQHNLRVTAYWLLLRSWNVLSLLALAALIYFVLRSSASWSYERRPLRSRAWPLYSIVAVFVFGCMSPYLGLKNHPCIAMWSNLYVMNNHSNHLLIPAGALTVFPYLDDMVEIKATNSRSLEHQYVRRNRLIAFSMLCRRVQGMRERGLRRIHLRYTRGGVLCETFQAELDPEFQKKESYLFRKWVLIKDGNKRNIGLCSS